MKLLVVLLLFVIIGIMIHAMLLLVRGPQAPQRLARALTWRVALSCGLFALLLLARQAGWLAT